MERLYQIHKHFIKHKNGKVTNPEDAYELESSKDILYEPYGSLLKVVLNRPDQHNAVTNEMQNDFMLRKLDIDKKYKICLMKGTNGNFCAGGDLKQFLSLDLDSKIYHDLSPYCLKFYYDCRNLKPITVVFWEGLVMGGGVGMSCTAKFRIATETTRFAMPEAKIGHYADVGASSVLANTRKHIGMMLGLTSTVLRGKEVYQCGFANFYVKQQNLPLLERVLEEYGQSGEEITEAGVEQIIRKFSEDIEQTIEWEDICEKIFSGDSVLEIISRARKEQKSHPIVSKWIKSLEYNSPFSLWLIHQLVTRVKNWSLEELLSREVLLYSKLRSDDMMMGVQAVLSKSTEMPDWSVKLEEIPLIKTEDYFSDIETIDFKNFPISVFKLRH